MLKDEKNAGLWIRKNDLLKIPYGAIPKNLCVRLSGNMVDKGAPTKLANRLGIQTSTVTTKGDQTCVAYKQDGECRDCTLCWNTSNMNTSYPLH